MNALASVRTLLISRTLEEYVSGYATSVRMGTSDAEVDDAAELAGARKKAGG